MAGTSSCALSSERRELYEIEEEIRHALEHLIMLDEHDYRCDYGSSLVSQLEAKQAEVLSRLRDIEQELDHAFRR